MLETVEGVERSLTTSLYHQPSPRTMKDTTTLRRTQTDRQTDKQTNRQTDKQTNRQTDKQTNRQNYLHPLGKQRYIFKRRKTLSIYLCIFPGKAKT